VLASCIRGLETAKSSRIRETPAIFLEHGRELQSQSTTGLNMPHNRFSPDLSFFDEKMKFGLCAHGP
jgi:hypothetical protein